MGMADSFQEFIYLNTEDYERKIQRLTPEELYRLHAQVCRAAVGGQISTATTVIEAPLTLGLSLLFLPVAARKWDVNNKKQEIIEKQLKKLGLTGYSVKGRDYLWRVAIAGATFGAAMGLEPVIEEGLEFVGDVVSEVFDIVGDVGTEVDLMESLRGRDKVPQNVDLQKGSRNTNEVPHNVDLQKASRNTSEVPHNVDLQKGSRNTGEVPHNVNLQKGSRDTSHCHSMTDDISKVDTSSYSIRGSELISARVACSYSSLQRQRASLRKP